MMEYNREILVYLHSLLEYPIIEKLSLASADIPIFFLPIYLVVAWVYYTYIKKGVNKKKDLLFIFYSCAITIAINLGIQSIVHLDRPESALEGSSKLILEHLPDASFPSDHAAVSIAFLVGLFLAGQKKTAYIYLIFALSMSIARVILGVHWPIDIIAGGVIGIFAAFISFKILKKLNFVDSINNFILRIASYIKL